MEHKDIQKKVNELFVENFGRTPLTKRLKDIDGECRELCNYIDLKNLKEETGDLLASLIQLCNESDWDIVDLLERNHAKIIKRSLQYKSLGRKNQVAILGGAFNPVTKSHLELANFVLNTSKWADEVWLMPAYKHLDGKQMLSPEHRLKMLELATQNDGRIKVSDYEIKHKLGGETYFMLSKLLNDPEYENCRFAFIIGIDRANSIHNWYNSDELLKLDVPFLVCPRKGFKRDEKVNWYLNNHHMYLEEDDSPVSGFSSTMVRNILSKKYPPQCDFEEVEKMLDANVLQYITKHGLYLNNF